MPTYKGEGTMGKDKDALTWPVRGTGPTVARPICGTQKLHATSDYWIPICAGMT